MSNQIVISSGAKVRSLEGVLTGTAGIVNSVPLGGANGVATLDSLGKVPLSQLPASVVTYLGTWNAATNTPTLTNGVGDVGDLYICNVAGTVNFGAGPITFAVGDWVIYSGTEWQKSAGASGTVTSIAVTESGDALTITGSPITTSGTINIGFAGTGSQYIKGDGTLATFPTTIDQAKRLITEVYNSTGATLSKGTVVYINGGQGNLPTVTKAQANADNTSAQTYGVVQSDITNNNNGFVVVIGSLTDIDTQAYAVGTQLYLSGTTAGDWTSTKPSAPIHLVYVGIVVRSHPTQGVVEIRIQNGYELEELHDVAISAPVNNQGIFYNSSTDLWENKSIATALGYTPANDALVVHLAGTETITGAKTFTDNTIFSASPLFDQSANYKVGASLVGTGNYIAMAFDKSGTGSGSILSMKLADGTTAKAINLDFLGSPATYTYTFPALNGTIALLEGTQTFTGDKTFNGGVDFNNALNINNTFNLRNNLVGSTLYTNFSILKSGSLQTLTYLFSTANSSKLVFNDAANYTYTFPTTSGTLALASDLGNYVTLATTQTITGAKTFTQTTAVTGNLLVRANSGNIGQALVLEYGTNGTGVNALTGVAMYSNAIDKLDILYTNSGTSSRIARFVGSSITNNSTREYTLPDASGTLALTSNLSSYVPYTGATSDVNLGTTYSLSANNITAAGVVKSDFGLQLKSGLTTTISGYLSISAQKVSTNSQLNVYTDTGFYFSLIAPNTANYSYTYPASSGTLVLGTGTTNYLPKFTGASTIGNSLIFDNGTNGIGVGTTSLITFTNYNTISVNGTEGGAFVTMSNGTSALRLLSGSTDSALWEPRSVPVLFATANTERMRITSTGNVGIGTSSPTCTLEVARNNGGSTGGQIALRNSSSSTLNSTTEISFLNDTGASASGTRNGRIVSQMENVGNGASNMQFWTWSGSTDTERMRITSDGAVLVGASSTPSSSVSGVALQNPRLLGPTLFSSGNVSDSRSFVQFINANGVVGQITTSGTSTSYVTSSDYRLKQDLKDYNGLHLVSAIKTYDYEWKSDNTRSYGVLAHELEEVIPQAVYGEKDGEEMQGVDYSKIVPILIKSIQELSAKVTALENK